MSFSIWCDFIHKDFLENEFKNLIDLRIVNGATSNPAIFAKSLQTPAYRASITALAGKKPKEIYEHLAMADIHRAAQILKPLWEQNSANGLVSLEIDPFLCDDVGLSVDEGVRLYKHINMPNVMIKVPATSAGYEVMSALVREGIHVNATLIFTPQQAKMCADALQQGMQKGKFRSEADSVQGVISVFVSRFDRAVDNLVAEHLRAQMGIINAQECYEVIEHYKMPCIRTLFASTGVKEGAKGSDGKPLAQSYYIDKLILPHSVNTAPLEAIRAYQTSTDKAQKSPISPHARAAFWEELAKYNINRDEVAEALLKDGLQAFKQSFEDMLKAL